MSVGYVAVTVVFFVVALPCALAAYYYYVKLSIRKIPIPCAVWHVIALYVCVLPFPLLVVDIDAALYAASNEDAKDQKWMQPIWITIFAVTYFCAWISLPVAQMYTEVGDFSWKKAVLHSIKLNLKLYAVIISIILVFFVYILILKGAYTSLGSVLKIGVSLANAWGLLILTLFMPAGLVGVPRMLWRCADARKLLHRHLFDAVDIQEDLDLAAMDLASVKAELINIDPLVSDENRPHLSRMLELISEADREIPQYHIAARRVKIAPCTDRNDVSLDHLEGLHARLKKAIKIASRANYRWNTTVHECGSLDEIIRGAKHTNNSLKKLWFSILQYVYWAGCGIFSILTALILWSELVLPFRQLASKPIAVIELVMNSSAHFVSSVVLLFYMAYCSYWAAFQVKIFDVYVMYPSIADNASICFNEVFLVRLLMPLCFNFLLISGFTFNAEVDVMYGHVYRRNMDISLLFGEWVNRFLPILIPFIAAIVFFNLTQRALALVGVEMRNPNDLESPSVRQRIEDGRKLVENELGRQLAAAALPGDAPERGEAADTASASQRMAREESTGVAVEDTGRGSRYRAYLEKKKAAAQNDEGVV